jgi:hypothetical protein
MRAQVVIAVTNGISAARVWVPWFFQTRLYGMMPNQLGRRLA